ncbi:MAG: hypothetical protein MUO97_12275 [Dehalococcoidia bacterium]|nr:hypothetical protein [Dehalococcoidia bacterium]
MNWFERHLNWSLFFAVVLLPVIVGMIWLVLYLSVIGGIIATAMAGGEPSPDFVQFWFSTLLPYAIISLLVGIGLTIFEIVATLWYLGKKGRSKGFIILLIGPWIFAFISAFINAARFGEILGALGWIVGLIIIFLLENRAIGYGGDFVGEPVTDRWPDTGQLSAYDNRQTKELEYRDVSDVSVASGEAPAETSAEATVEAHAETSAETPVETSAVTPAELPAEAKVTEEAVRHETLNTPILLDDAGVVIKCFYHPDADAVNLCSRCRQYVCSQCNYVTGTHPICRNCWDKRAETPILPVSSEAQKGVKLSKSEKRKAEESERLREFMQLYEQALPVISAVIKKRAEGLLASPFDLTEWLKLRPMLEQAKKLPKPKDKELHEAKKEFEQLLLVCSKVAETAEFISSGGQAIPSEAEFARLDAGIETANGLMERLSQRVASLSQSPK